MESGERRAQKRIDEMFGFVPQQCKECGRSHESIKTLSHPGLCSLCDLVRKGLQKEHEKNKAARAHMREQEQMIKKAFKGVDDEHSTCDDER